MKPQDYRPHSAAVRQGGFTLIEILVSVIVLSIGMLGIAGLQAATASYKVNTWALNSSAVLVSDLADRIRANPSQAGNAYGDTSVVNSLYTLRDLWIDQAPPPAAPSKDCLLVSCTPNEVAQHDLFTWRNEVRRVMPQGSAWIEGSRADGFKVTLMWADKTHVTGYLALVETPTCESTATGAAQVNCCPEDADVAPGVRCLRFSFIP